MRLRVLNIAEKLDAFYAQKPLTCILKGDFSQRELLISEHNPPHFHATYNGQRAQFSIDPLEMIEGDLPPRIQRYVIEWAAIHQKEIMKNWNRLREEKQIKKIGSLV
jgi:hypothetical protein